MWIQQQHLEGDLLDQHSHYEVENKQCKATKEQTIAFKSEKPKWQYCITVSELDLVLTYKNSTKSFTSLTQYIRIN